MLEAKPSETSTRRFMKKNWKRRGRTHTKLDGVRPARTPRTSASVSRKCSVLTTRRREQHSRADKLERSGPLTRDLVLSFWRIVMTPIYDELLDEFRNEPDTTFV